MDDLVDLKLRIRDLTRELDESPAAEGMPEIETKLAQLMQRLEDMRRSMSATDVVREFCEAWSRRDIDELLTFFTDDAVYHNMPIAPVQGLEGIRNMLNLFVPGAQAITFEIVHIAAEGNVVHTERVDSFDMGASKIVLPVAGVFELRDGKIAAWRDYFDMGAWTAQSEA